MSKYDEILSNITLQIENGRRRRLRRLEKVIPRTAASSRSKTNLNISAPCDCRLEKKEFLVHDYRSQFMIYDCRLERSEFLVTKYGS